MILALDVHYRDDGTARAAGIVFPAWESDQVVEEVVVKIDVVSEYVPGAFYLRELPCLLKVLEHVKSRYDWIVIDGYVYLGDEKRPGLGMRLWEALAGRVPVVGVAKSRYLPTAEYAEVCRATSRRPLFVTAVGIPPDEAKDAIRRMEGSYRIPTLLKRLDRLARDMV